ncbi:MAG: cupin domain-containing protein [Gemmatimonadota bacterium]|nr:cupin domain-containing protein [Gemmatimonadota bacterium]
MSTPRVIDLGDKLGSFDELWSPRIIAELNGQHVKLAKVRGSFEWHHHESEDELFLVVAGELVIDLRDGRLTLGPGQCCVIPRGVEHRPRADVETHLLLFEPAGTLNTGNVRGE